VEYPRGICHLERLPPSRLRGEISKKKGGGEKNAHSKESLAPLACRNLRFKERGKGNIYEMKGGLPKEKNGGVAAFETGGIKQRTIS